MDDIGTVITLRAGRATLGVAPRIGGSIAHFHWMDGSRRHDWLRPASQADLASGQVHGLASFPLVPFSNRIRAGRFAFGGHAVQLPLNCLPEPHAQHGHGWQAAWTAIERAATTGDWRASPSKLCDWCDHRALCPAWGGRPPPIPAEGLARLIEQGADLVVVPGDAEE